jgi:hypothetical protein
MTGSQELGVKEIDPLVARQRASWAPGVSISTLRVAGWVSGGDVLVLLAELHHGLSGRATVSSGTRKEAQHVRVEGRA